MDTTPVISASKRERVLSYVWDRCLKAWKEDALEEAADLSRLMTCLESMTDDEYEEMYEGCDEADL